MGQWDSGMQGSIPKSYLRGNTSTGIALWKQWEFEKNMFHSWDRYWDDVWFTIGILGFGRFHAHNQ